MIREMRELVRKTIKWAFLLLHRVACTASAADHFLLLPISLSFHHNKEGKRPDGTKKRMKTTSSFPLLFPSQQITGLWGLQLLYVFILKCRWSLTCFSLPELLNNFVWIGLCRWMFSSLMLANHNNKRSSPVGVFRSRLVRRRSHWKGGNALSKKHSKKRQRKRCPARMSNAAF